MAQLTKDEKALLNGLFNKYGLSMDDIFRHQHFTIIKRTGVDKVMARGGIAVSYEVVACDREHAAVQATAHNEEGRTVTTFGSASPDNCRSPYYLEMAEKRAKSRAVLMLCGLYEHGVYSEVEEAHIDR